MMSILKLLLKYSENLHERVGRIEEYVCDDTSVPSERSPANEKPEKTDMASFLTDLKKLIKIVNTTDNITDLQSQNLHHYAFCSTFNE